MAVTYNIKGTTNSSFKVGKSGTGTVFLNTLSADDLSATGNLTVSGNLIVSGTTTTVNSTNTTLDDNLLELNSGATSNANDSGIIIERGSTGNNAIFVWDESADGFIVGTTTATASDTGNLSITAAPFAASTLSATELDMGDNQKIKLGASNDLEIYHDGSHSYVEDTGTGDLKLKASIVEIQNTDATVGAKFTGDGSVELNHDGTKKFETTSAGATITGVLTSDGLDVGDNEKIRLGDSQDLEIYHDGSDSYIKDAGTGNLRLEGTDVRVANSGGTADYIRCTNGGAVDLLHNNSVKVSTSASGVSITGTATATTFSGSGASLTSLPAGNLTGTLPAISGANLTNLPLGPTSATAVGALKEFAILFFNIFFNIADDNLASVKINPNVVAMFG